MCYYFSPNIIGLHGPIGSSLSFSSSKKVCLSSSNFPPQKKNFHPLSPLQCFNEPSVGLGDLFPLSRSVYLPTTSIPYRRLPRPDFLSPCFSSSVLLLDFLLFLSSSISCSPCDSFLYIHIAHLLTPRPQSFFFPSSCLGAFGRRLSK